MRMQPIARAPEERTVNVVDRSDQSIHPGDQRRPFDVHAYDSKVGHIGTLRVPQGQDDVGGQRELCLDHPGVVAHLAPPNAIDYGWNH